MNVFNIIQTSLKTIHIVFFKDQNPGLTFAGQYFLEAVVSFTEIIIHNNHPQGTNGRWTNFLKKAKMDSTNCAENWLKELIK